MEQRNSRQQSLVMDAMKTECDHPTAEQVWAAVREECPNMSLGTVYRILNKFSQNGILRKIDVPNGRDRFDITVSNHYHLCCETCGKFTDTDIVYDDSINRRMKDKYGETVREHDIVFYWLCPECADKNNDNEKI